MSGQNGTMPYTNNSQKMGNTIVNGGHQKVGDTIDNGGHKKMGDTMYTNNTQKMGDTTVKMDHSASVAIDTPVGIVGAGNFGLALSGRLAKAGVLVTLGSRRTFDLAGRYKEDQGGIRLASQEEAMAEKVVILAVPYATYSDLALDTLKPGTILVDCSNRACKCRDDQLSQAEKLQVPAGVHVVKAFNTVSAYELDHRTAGRKEIAVAGNNQMAKQVISSLVERLGFQVSDYGNLVGARDIENLPLSLFADWRCPLVISVLLWIFLYFMTWSRYHLCHNNSLTWFPDWPTMSADAGLKYINKTCDAHALTVLASCYLPGVLAAHFQLARGTKYSEFPAWLDRWMKMRKQLGLLMLLSASIHGCLYAITASWKFYYTVQIPLPVDNAWNWTQMASVQGERVPFDWRVNVFMTAGVLGFGLAVILGITSLPSVSSSLSWREFRSLQSWLGWLCLVFSCLHCGLRGWSRLIKMDHCMFLANTQIPLILPLITFILKLPLLIPFVDKRLTNIRNGVIY